MKFLYSTVVSVGPAVLLLALILMLVYFLNWRSAPEPKKHLSAGVYVLVSLAAGAAAFLAGAAAGIWLACSSADSSNLCGLVGVFGLGPLFAGVAIWSCAYSLTRAPKEVPLGGNAKQAP